jgi:hypothetical protein
MNATHRPVARRADLSPFFIPLATQEHLPGVRTAVSRESCSGRAESDPRYGCVDWYQYGVISRLQAPQQRNLS